MLTERHPPSPPPHTHNATSVSMLIIILLGGNQEAMSKSKACVWELILDDRGTLRNGYL
jgi:hypothetical protein